MTLGLHRRALFHRGAAPEADDDRTALVDALQDYKVQAYKDFISAGAVPARPGVLRLMDEARDAGLKVAVCSASAKPAVIHVLSNLLGESIFDELDCFLAGDDVEALRAKGRVASSFPAGAPVSQDGSPPGEAASAAAASGLQSGVRSCMSKRRFPT